MNVTSHDEITTTVFNTGIGLVFYGLIWGIQAIYLQDFFQIK